MVTMGQWTGREARLLRQALRLTVRDFAEDLGVSPRTISKWESAGAARTPRPELQAALDTLLGRATEQERQRFEHICGHEPDAPDSVAHGKEVVSAALPMAKTINLTASSVFSADAAESSQFARFLSLNNINETTIEQLDADTTQLARIYVSRPARQLFRDIRELREVTFGLLRGRQWPKHTSSLLVIASRLCGLSAHVCLDTGDYTSAATHTRTAWTCAEAAGDNRMQAWVRSLQSLIAFWSGDPRHAVDLAKKGQMHSKSPNLLVRLASLEARALAILGAKDPALQALLVAEKARESRHFEEEMPGVFGFPDAKQFTYAGTTHLAFGTPNINIPQAITFSETAVVLYGQMNADDRSTYDILAAHFDIARGHTLAGRFDQANDLLVPIWNIPPTLLSASILSRLGSLFEELNSTKNNGSSEAAGLQERIMNTIQLSLEPTTPAAESESKP